MWLNTLRRRQDGRHFPDDIFKCTFLNENARMSLNKSLKFVPKFRINNIPALVQIMAWRRSGDKPLSEPMVVSLMTHICVTRPQWVKVNKLSLNIKKTHFMIFTRKMDGEIDIKIDNEAITETKSSKFLWGCIDNNLNWKIHINYITGKLSRGIGTLYKARKISTISVSLHCITLLYTLFVIYCNYIWRNILKSSLHKLQVLQSQALRLITKESSRSYL